MTQLEREHDSATGEPRPLLRRVEPVVESGHGHGSAPLEELFYRALLHQLASAAARSRCWSGAPRNARSNMARLK